MSNLKSILRRKISLPAVVALTAVCALGAQELYAQEVVAIAAGGPAQSNAGGGDVSFTADQDFTGGGNSQGTHAVINLAQPGVDAAPMAVYQHGRAGVSTYTIHGLTAGNSYTVLLHFAETYFKAKGQRAFNVAINGTSVLTNFDIFALSGANAALLESFNATANAAGEVVIAFTNGAANQPLVMGLEVRDAVANACVAVPSAPTSLAATASSSTAVALSWGAATAPANCTVNSYNVYRSAVSNFVPSASNLIASGVNATSYANTGLTAATTYFYAVEALDSKGLSASSNVATAVTPAAACTTVPSAPSGLTAATTSPNAIGLTWNAVAPPSNCAVSGYNVYRSTVSGFLPSASNLVASGVTGTSYSNTGLAVATTYYYEVAAVDTDGVSAPSLQASAVTPAAGLSEIVAIAAGGPAESNTSGGDATFQADQYFVGGAANGAVTAAINLAQAGADAAPMGVYQHGRVGAATYTIPGLAPGAQYMVLLHFAETFFAVANSRTFDVAINGTTVLPALDVFATVGKDVALVKSFTATANASGQIVIALIKGKKDSPLIMGMEVRGAASACTLAPTIAPTGLTASASSPSIVNLAWSGVAPPPNCGVTYNVYGSTASSVVPSASTLVASGLTSASFSQTGLTPSTTYNYVVTAVDTAGASPASAAASAQTHSAASCISTPTVPPSGLTVTPASSSTIGVRWVPLASPQNCTNLTYNVYSSTTSGFTPSVNNEVAVGLTGMEFFNTGLDPASTHYYVVQAADEDGAGSAFSQQQSAITLPPPSTLMATASSSNEIDLTFPASAAPAPVTYRIYRSATSPFTPSSKTLVGTTKSNFYNDVVLTAGTHYFYIVQAASSAGTTTVGAPVDATTLPLPPNTPPFWDASNIPATPSGDRITIKFLNRTNGQYPDSQVFWRATVGGVVTTNSIAAQPTFSMPANASGRIYFFLGAVNLNNNNYWDFLEYTLGTNFMNMNATRVDAFGLKYAFRLSCADGTDIAVGETGGAFVESRASFFQRYMEAVPAEFQPLAQVQAPFRIVSPGSGGFDKGGAHETYYNDWITELWRVNGITIPLAIPNGDGLGNFPALSAAIYRHIGGVAGTFNSDGTLKNQALFGNPSAFYQTAPTSYYAKFLHANAINAQQYAFPFDDAGGYSSDVSCTNPQTLIVAIGW